MKTVFFDFDGTIADSIPLILEIVNDVLKVYGYRKLTKEKILDIKEMSISSILKESKINYFLLPFMFLHGKLMFRKKQNQIQPIIGIKDVILLLQDKGYKIGIVTSNSKDSIESFLRLNNFPTIDYIYASINLFGKDKLIKKCLKENNLDAYKTIYVGDEIRDIEASKKAGIKCIAVGWGFNSSTSLERANPIAVISKVADLFKEIETLKL